ncbi:hypothetical protein KKA39_02550 [Patescibacteria group bacterium]|nr:hypothetical protein [Patescibacteria group bacterium]MBU1728156.1 hypothetical protein [Patescibacteria group bacterium]
MDIKDLNKSQLILLAILLSFIVSIATGITTVTLMEQAPESVTIPINRVIQQTVEKIVPVSNKETITQALSEDQKKLLEELKAIKPLTVSLFLKEENEDKLLGTGLFLGDNRVVIASVIPEQNEGEVYIVKSILGEQVVSKITREKDFTIIEVVDTSVPVIPDPNLTPTSDSTMDTNDGSILSE